MISEGTTAVQAFEAGELDMTAGLPPEEIPRLKDTAEYAQYPGLGTYYLRVQREGRAGRQPAPRDGARDRPPEIIDNIAQADQLPATGFTPQGMPGFDVLNPDVAVAARDG